MTDYQDRELDDTFEITLPLVHTRCSCRPHHALCGAEIIGIRVNLEAECLVCRDLYPICPRCGTDLS